MSWQSVFDMLSKLKFFMATKLPLLLCLPRNTIARSEKHEPSTEHIVYCFRSGSKFMASRCHCTVYRVEKRACRTAPRNDDDWPSRATTDFRPTQARTQTNTRTESETITQPPKSRWVLTNTDAEFTRNRRLRGKTVNRDCPDDSPALSPRNQLFE